MYFRFQRNEDGEQLIPVSKFIRLLPEVKTLDPSQIDIFNSMNSTHASFPPSKIQRFFLHV